MHVLYILYIYLCVYIYVYIYVYSVGLPVAIAAPPFDVLLCCAALHCPFILLLAGV
jgi:hypothetical protein